MVAVVTGSRKTPQAKTSRMLHSRLTVDLMPGNPGPGSLRDAIRPRARHAADSFRAGRPAKVYLWAAESYGLNVSCNEATAAEGRGWTAGAA